MANFKSILFVFLLISCFKFLYSNKNKLKTNLRNVDPNTEQKLLNKVKGWQLVTPTGKLVYGDQIIRIRHVTTGYYLDSLPKFYDDSGAKEQEVIVSKEPSANSEWMVIYDGNLTNGSKLRLTHLQTKKNLHGLGKLEQITKT